MNIDSMFHSTPARSAACERRRRAPLPAFSPAMARNLGPLPAAPTLSADAGADEYATTPADGAPNVEADADADRNAAPDLTFSPTTPSPTPVPARPNDSSRHPPDFRAGEPRPYRAYCHGRTVSRPTTAAATVVALGFHMWASCSSTARSSRLR